jgi:hypothetical protein
VKEIVAAAGENSFRSVLDSIDVAEHIDYFLVEYPTIYCIFFSVIMFYKQWFIKLAWLDEFLVLLLLLLLKCLGLYWSGLYIGNWFKGWFVLAIEYDEFWRKLNCYFFEKVNEKKNLPLLIDLVDQEDLR